MDQVQASDSLSGAELRQARFPQSRRGYDPESVHAFLDRVADWVESRAGAANADPGVTSCAPRPRSTRTSSGRTLRTRRAR